MPFSKWSPWRSRPLASSRFLISWYGSRDKTMIQKWTHVNGRQHPWPRTGLGRSLALMLLCLVWGLPATGQERLTPESRDGLGLLDAWQNAVMPLQHTAGPAVGTLKTETPAK